jgi:hypothetical protein
MIRWSGKMSNLRSRVRALLEARARRPAYSGWTAEQCDAEIERIFEGIRARQATGCVERQPVSPEGRAQVARIVAHFAAVAEREAKHAQLAAYAAEDERRKATYAAAEPEPQAAEAERQRLGRLWEASRKGCDREDPLAPSAIDQRRRIV